MSRNRADVSRPRFPVQVECSGEGCDLKTVLRSTGEVQVSVPSNGLRGSKHVPAHEATTEWWLDRDEDAVIYWECPACGYAESYVFWED